MAEIIIDNVKYTNVPNKKAGTKFASALTQSNIGMSQAVQDYVNGSYFYPLVNAIDINWDGIEIGENSYINNTSDLIKWVIEKGGDVDLSSYATITYVNDKITELIGAAPETLDTLGEIAAALQDDASLAYVTEALSGKANAADVYDKTSVDNMFSGLNSTYATTSYVTTELEKKADVEAIPVIPDMSNYVTMTSYNMLVQRVDELANLIAYYHPAQPEQQIEGYWTLNGVRTDSVQISTSDSPITLSFVSNPTIASGIGRWEFNDRQPGIVIDTTTGAMTINPMYLNADNWYGVSYYYYDANGNQILSSYINVQVTASSKPYATGQWLDSNMNIVYDKVVAAGDSTTYTFTFDGTPSTGWSFSYDGGGFAGVDYDTTTGTVTIDVGNRTDYVKNYVYLYANYPEDSTYQYTTSIFNAIILPTGTNPNFYYEENNINFNNQMGQYTPTLKNTLSSYDHITYVSSDSGVATVELNGVLYYVADGNCTLTATAYDSSDNVLATATANVTCETLKDWPHCTWSNVNNGKVAVASGNTTPVTCTFTGTPASGWVIQQSTYAGITCNTSTCDVTIDATNMQVGQYTIDCTYPEDATYYSVNNQLIIDIIPAGSNPEFYFDNTTVNIDSGTEPHTVYPIINLPAYDHLVFTSSDTSVATVSNSGDVYWQSAGTCTITATAYDISNNVLATASYTCICASPQPTCYWSCNGGVYNDGDSTSWTVDEERTDTFTFTGTPASGWTFNYPTGTGITANTTTGEITIDTTAISSKGTYTLTASYPGDSTYSSAQYSITITLEKRAAAVWKDSNDVAYNIQYEMNINDVDTTLTFNGTPLTGWTFNNNGVSGISIDSNGDILIQPLRMTAGTYWISAQYPEDATYSNTDTSFAIIISGASPQPTPDYTNVSLLYSVPATQTTNLPQGTFDTNPFEIGSSAMGNDITASVEFSGSEYDMSYFNTDFVLTRDTSYAGSYTTVIMTQYPNDSISNTYSNGVNTITFNISIYPWQGTDETNDGSGTNRDVLTFTHNGYNYFTDGIKSYYNEEAVS